MKLKTFMFLFRQGKLYILSYLIKLLKPFYRLCYIASAASNGLLEALSAGALPFEALASRFSPNTDLHEALHAWLQLGIRLGELKLDDSGYALKGFSRKLADPKNEALIAFIQEVVYFHHLLILKTPEKLKQGAKWDLTDQDGETIARSSLILEPFQKKVIALTFPKNGAVQLLEVGCGSALYIRHAAEHNPHLSAIGVELQPKVATTARQNIAQWKLQERVQIECQDIRQQTPKDPFDIVTLYNNIYYFPVKERAALLTHLSAFLKPGGFLLLTTGCQKGSLSMEMLNLWGAATNGCGRLPTVEEMTGQLKQAGFDNIQVFDLLPGDQYYAFKGSKKQSLP